MAEHPVHYRRLTCIGNELLRPWLDFIADGHGASDPMPSSFQANAGFRDPRSYHFAFELGGRGEDVQHQVVLRAVSKFKGGNNHQADTAFTKLLQQVGAPEQATREPIQNDRLQPDPRRASGRGLTGDSDLDGRRLRPSIRHHRNALEAATSPASAVIGQRHRRPRTGPGMKKRHRLNSATGACRWRSEPGFGRAP